MKKIYDEPEFKVITTNCDDVLTTSGEGGNALNKAGGWEVAPYSAPFISL